MAETKKKLLIGIIVVGFVVLAGILVYRKWKKPPISVIGQPATSTALESKAEQTKSDNQAFVEAIQKVYQTDKDFDGLSDADEQSKYHTDQEKADTDGDGLLDGDEIKLYKTDPLKLDTNGIGHSDGWGAQHGVILPTTPIITTSTK